MLIEIPERDPRVELLAAALCASEHSVPGAWDYISEPWRQGYRREARELLTQLDTVVAGAGCRMPTLSDRCSAHPPAGAAGQPTYRRDAVSLGPFAAEPLDMWDWFLRSPEGSLRSGDEIRAAAVRWLLGALADAGVAVGDYDRTVVGCACPGQRDDSTGRRWVDRPRPMARASPVTRP